MSKAKAYCIDGYYVAAHNWMQAAGTLAAHLDVEPDTIGKAVEVNPAEVEVSFEQEDGTYEKGNLSELMPSDSDPNPEVMIDPDYP